jgi:hypothetical protein
MSKEKIMLNGLAVLVVLFLTLSASSASAQNTIIDSNGTVVGNVVGVSQSDIVIDTLKAVVARQDENGLWVAMELIADGFLPSATVAVRYYTDTTCSTTPYLLVSGGTPLFRKMRGFPMDQVSTTGYYAGDPLVTLTFQSFWNFASGGFCSLTSTFSHLAGPAIAFDLTQFVPPFSVAPPSPPVPTSPLALASPGHRGGQLQPLPVRSRPLVHH